MVASVFNGGGIQSSLMYDLCTEAIATMDLHNGLNWITTTWHLAPRRFYSCLLYYQMKVLLCTYFQNEMGMRYIAFA